MRTLVLLTLLVAGAAQAKLNVVATTGDLGALAREIAGPDATVALLAKPTQDPHFVDPKPSLVIALARADLLILNGMELELGWLPTLITSSRNPRLLRGQLGHLDCSTLITPLEVPVGKLDRSMGDIHPGGNPHYTKDPRNAEKLAQGIAARLAELDPEHAGAYQGRAAAFAASAQQRIAAWRALLEPFRGQPIVPYHKSWIYFVDFAGLSEVAFIEPKPGLPPSTGHVAKVLQVLKARKVPVMLQEDWYPAATSELLAQKSGARLVRVPGMAGEKDAYLDYLEQIVRQVTAALASAPK